MGKLSNRLARLSKRMNLKPEASVTLVCSSLIENFALDDGMAHLIKDIEKIIEEHSRYRRRALDAESEEYYNHF